MSAATPSSKSASNPLPAEFGISKLASGELVAFIVRVSCAGREEKLTQMLSATLTEMGRLDPARLNVFVYVDDEAKKTKNCVSCNLATAEKFSALVANAVLLNQALHTLIKSCRNAEIEYYKAALAIARKPSPDKPDKFVLSTFKVKHDLTELLPLIGTSG